MQQKDPELLYIKEWLQRYNKYGIISSFSHLSSNKRTLITYSTVLKASPLPKYSEFLYDSLILGAIEYC